MSNDIITPHDDEAELHLLCELAQHQERLMPEFVIKLREEHFWDSAKRAVWRELKKDFLAGEPSVQVAFRDRLIAGHSAHEFNVLLTDVFSVLRGTTGMIAAARQSYNILEKHRKLRAALEANLAITEAIHSGNLEDVQRGADAMVTGLSESARKHGRSVHEIMDTILAKEMEKPERGIPFACLPWLSDNLGGLQRKNLIIIAGPRGSGKSALGAQIVWHAAQHANIQASYHSHEMGDETVVKRLVSLEGVRSSYWTNGILNEYDKRAMSRFNSSQIQKKTVEVYEDFTRIDEVIAQMRLDVMRRGMRVAVVDLIQRVKGDRREGREQELSGIAWDLKTAANSLDITVIAMSHLNKQLTARGSEDIENHADQMVIIGVEENEDQRAEKKRCLFKITKNRGGPSGIRCIHDFIGPNYKFVEVEETDEDLEPPQYQDRGNSNTHRRRHNDE